jgi:hypothetical protein
MLIGGLNACAYIKHCPTYEEHYSSYKGKHHAVKRGNLSYHHRTSRRTR